MTVQETRPSPQGERETCAAAWARPAAVFENSPAIHGWDFVATNPKKSRPGRKVLADGHQMFLPSLAGLFHLMRAFPAINGWAIVIPKLLVMAIPSPNAAGAAWLSDVRSAKSASSVGAAASAYAAPTELGRPHQWRGCKYASPDGLHGRQRLPASGAGEHGFWRFSG